MNQQRQHIHPAGFALGLTASILYALCAAAVKLWPAQTVRFFSSWFHGIDLIRIFDPTLFTWSVFFKGLVSVVIIAYLSGVVYALIYGKCVDHCKRKGWI